MHEELTLFVEKAWRLETSKFWEWLSSRRGSPDMQKIISGDWLAHDGLDQDALDAFCLNLRLLIQDGDGFSIRKIENMATLWPENANGYSNEILSAVKTLRDGLRDDSLVQIYPSRKTSKMELFDIIFYGGIAHSNPSKRRKFQEITESGVFSFFVFMSFVDCLFLYRNCIQTIAYNIYQYQNSELYGYSNN